MSTASVWNWDRLEYDYYRIPGNSSIGGWGSSMAGLGGGSGGTTRGIGVDIEDALPKLPRTARRMGSGKEAVGHVMVKPRKASGGLSGEPEGDNLGLVVGVAGVAFLGFLVLQMKAS